MHSDVARDKEIVPGEWVQAALDARNLDDMHAGVAVRVSNTTIYRWRKGGCAFPSWIGLLVILGLPPDWRPGAAVPRVSRDWRPGEFKERK